jgi:acyl carrier protein
VNLLISVGSRSLREGETAEEFTEGLVNLDFAGLGLDSLGWMELAIGLENQFHYSITPEELSKVSTVGELCEKLEAG